MKSNAIVRNTRKDMQSQMIFGDLKTDKPARNPQRILAFLAIVRTPR